jgi:hypothetical protein
LYSRAPAFWIRPDTIECFLSPDGVSICRISGSETTDATLYDESKLTVRDQYAYFLGGNYPLIVVRSQCESMRKLLVIRDSYFDSAAPFFTCHFQEIHLLDPRYYRLPASDYIRENGIAAVLIQYSLADYAEDVNLPLVLK